jgi:hypothetical protein
MKEFKNVSSLKEHRLNRKKGIVSTPFNHSLGNLLQINSWTNDRMPEYLWMGLILLHYGRKEGFSRLSDILHDFFKSISSLTSPKLSALLSCSRENQILLFNIICNYIDKAILSPLTIIYKYKEYQLFNEYFFNPVSRVEDKIKTISTAVKLFSPHQSNEATDLRFIALSYSLISNKLYFADGLNLTVNTLLEYPSTDHDNELMRSYRPIVRSMEGSDVDRINLEFISIFWKALGMITQCNPMIINFDEVAVDYDQNIKDFKRVLEYILLANKDKSIAEDKFDVTIGSICYVLKIFNEIHQKHLGNSILGRHGVRTIIEILIILKYLNKREKEQANIWEEYKLYGISKYKLILLKAREVDLDKGAHFQPGVADVLINEIMWEEFIDLDLKYFDKQNIRDKSIDVGEKDLYDLLYDYDSNYSHGLWGAVRESSMLICDCATHQYHSIPDINGEQNLTDVKHDAMKVLVKIFLFLSEIYEIPSWFLEKYNLKK